MKINDNYNINLTINKDKFLKELRDIKKEIEEVTEVKGILEINRFKLKRRDILILHVLGVHKQSDVERMEKELKKKLRRKVLILDERVDKLSAIINCKELEIK